MVAKLNLTGQVFGRLTVVGTGPSKYKKTAWCCSCSCGNPISVIARSGDLRSGDTKSCGCIRRDVKESKTKLIKGNKFGNWTAIEEDRGRLKRNKRDYWICECSCGSPRKSICGRTLLKGGSKSCGCLRKTISHVLGVAALLKICLNRPAGYSGFKRCYRAVKYGARNRGLDFELTQEEAYALNKGDCYYCGVEPSQIMNSGRLKDGGTETALAHTKFIYNGIDRKDNRLGYIKTNCVSCCKSCNRAKHTLSEKEFICLAKRISSKFLNELDADREICVDAGQGDVKIHKKRGALLTNKPRPETGKTRI